MAEPTHRFKCLGVTKRDDGIIQHYTLAVTDLRSSRTVEISIEPGHLVSARSMKRILLGNCMFYSVAQKDHAQMLYEILPQPELI